MRNKFLEELMTLDEKILMMSGMVEQAIDTAITALFNQDGEKAGWVVGNDDAIDAMMRQIEGDCVNIIAMQQPVATDLRFIYTVLKISTDLERIGDHAVNIAEVVLRFSKLKPVGTYSFLPLMTHVATEMVHISIKSLVQRNEEMAVENCRRDSQIDRLCLDTRQDLIRLLSRTQDTESIEKLLDLFLLAYNVERIADHATNIGERVIYLVSGKKAQY
jgi:phosphate transport system protein